MFGTLKPKTRDLSPRQKRTYRNHYCGVCAGLGTHMDTISRATLSHDAVLFALIGEGLKKARTEKSTTRCPLNPLHHRTIIDENSRPVRYATAVHTLWVDLWFADKIEDGTKIAKVGEKLWKHHGEKAKEILQGYGLDLEFLGPMTKTQARIEASNPSVLEASKITEEIFAYFFRHLNADVEDDEKGKLAYLGALVGRVIYLTDALKDLRRDRRRGDFNPCLEMGEICMGRVGSLKRIIREALIEMKSALHVLELNRNRAVCEQILTKHWPVVVEKEIARVEFLIENDTRKLSATEKWSVFKCAFLLFLSQFAEGIRQAFQFQRHAFSQAMGIHDCDAHRCKASSALAMSSNGFKNDDGKGTIPGFSSRKAKFAEPEPEPNRDLGDNPGFISLKEEDEEYGGIPGFRPRKKKELANIEKRDDGYDAGDACDCCHTGCCICDCGANGCDCCDSCDGCDACDLDCFCD